MKPILVLLALLASLTAQAAFTIGAYNIRNFDYDERYRIRTNKPALGSILNSLKADVMSVEEINNVVNSQTIFRRRCLVIKRKFLSVVVIMVSIWDSSTIQQRWSS